MFETINVCGFLADVDGNGRRFATSIEQESDLLNVIPVTASKINWQIQYSSDGKTWEKWEGALCDMNGQQVANHLAIHRERSHDKLVRAIPWVS